MAKGKIPYDRRKSTVEFDAVAKEARELGEAKDCAVKCVSILSGRSYAETHRVMASVGRKTRLGTEWEIIHAAFEVFGFKLVELDVREIISRYPGCDAKRKNITTYHTTLFNRFWKDGKSYLFYTHRHVAAVVDGVTHDWSVGRPLRVKRVFRVVPIETPLFEIAVHLDKDGEWSKRYSPNSDPFLGWMCMGGGASKSTSFRMRFFSLEEAEAFVEKWRAAHPRTDWIATVVEAAV